jgi:hypothetical protein
VDERGRPSRQNDASDDTAPGFGAPEERLTIMKNVAAVDWMSEREPKRRLQSTGAPFAALTRNSTLNIAATCIGIGTQLS